MKIELHPLMMTCGYLRFKIAFVATNRRFIDNNYSSPSILTKQATLRAAQNFKKFT